MIAAVVLFWGSLAALAWTHALYPLTVALAARVRTSRVAVDDAYLPTVAVIVTAYNEEDSIERRIENLRALDYPPELLELVVTSDASTDRTEELAEAAGARVIRNPRGGKVAAQDAAVRATDADVVAFSDANATWAPDALRKLVRNLADPDVAYVCGRLRLETADGSNKEGVYWRYELVTRDGESRLGSVTAGNGADLRAAALRLRRGRSPLRARPLAAVPHGAAREARGVRAGGARLRAADAEQRERVPAQGADVRARVAHRAAGTHAPRPAARLLDRPRLAPASSLRERSSPPDPARELDRAASATARSTSSSSASSSACSRRRSSASGSPATTSSSPGRRSLRSGTTSGAACPRRGRRSGRSSREPGGGRRHRGLGARARLAFHRHRRSRGQARGRRPGALPADARRPGRRRLRAAQAADDGRRRRDDGSGPLGQPRRHPDHARRARCCASSRSTSCRSSGTSSAGR